MSGQIYRYTVEFVNLFFLELIYAGPILVSLALAIALIGALIGRMEGWSRLDSLYHAFINATTVGYGDFRPTKKLTKLFSVANALIGLIFTGVCRRSRTACCGPCAQVPLE